MDDEVQARRGRPRLHRFWVERIRRLLSSNDRISLEEIRRTLLKDPAIKSGDAPTPPPSHRAIQRQKKDFLNLSKEDRLGYRLFSWPASMENGTLPWEASRVCLDLLKRYMDRGSEPPLNVLAVRFWQITQAAPDADIETRIDLAVHFAVFSALNQEDGLAELELFLYQEEWKRPAPFNKAFPTFRNMTPEKYNSPLVRDLIRNFDAYRVPLPAISTGPTNEVSMPESPAKKTPAKKGSKKQGLKKKGSKKGAVQRSIRSGKH